MNTDKIYAERLASEYAVKDTSKVTALKKLDRQAKLPATIMAYSVGIIAALVTGTGMCLSMKVIGSGAEMVFLGIILGLIGFAGMSRIESGKTVFEFQPFNIKDEMLKLADIAKPLCETRRQNFRCDFTGLTEQMILGDRTKLSLVLMNLLSNATKYTQEGGNIIFTAKDVHSLRKGMVSIHFAVQDNGFGVSEESLKKIFHPFERVDDRRVSKIEGTGLGLSICQNYVHGMGGTLTCESKLNEGSTFTVELFFERADAQQEEKKEQSTSKNEILFKGLRCLVCEDHPVNQKIAERLLRRLGFEVDVASDGEEGLKRFSDSEPGCYDIIYMDIQMPVMNGYEASAAIRSSTHPQAQTIPVIAMTANVFSEDVEKARSAGMNGHIGKPIDLSKLIEVTNEALKERNGKRS